MRDAWMTMQGDTLIFSSFFTHLNIICIWLIQQKENPFPVAINEVTRVYTSITSGDATSLLGFRPDKIIVTGESTGGNLAAALNVKLCLDGLVDVHMEDYTVVVASSSARTCTTNSDDSENSNETPLCHRLPDALMMCCPALNLSLDLSPSRVLTRDAVLPSTTSMPSQIHILGSIPKRIRWLLHFTREMRFLRSSRQHCCM